MRRMSVTPVQKNADVMIARWETTAAKKTILMRTRMKMRRRARRILRKEGRG